MKTKIDDILLKVHIIQNKMNDLKKENELLNRNNIDLKATNHQLEFEISKTKDDNVKLKLAQSLSGKSENSSENKLKINELVREIDNCIKLLTKQ